ncbi:hypothetical protein Tco_1200841, partial [Tanacetum coccineum]
NVVGKVIASKDSDLEKSHQTLQPARNPLRLCGICVGIDDRDDCNTSSSTSVPYGVSNLSTISHQQNHQATNSDIEHPKSRPKTINTSTSTNLDIEHPESWPKTVNTSTSLKTGEAIIPTSSEAFESLIKETFANAVRTTTSCYQDHGEKMEGITGMMAQTVGLERSLLYTVDCGSDSDAEDDSDNGMVVNVKVEASFFKGEIAGDGESHEFPAGDEMFLELDEVVFKTHTKWFILILISEIDEPKWALFYCKPKKSLEKGLKLLHTDNDVHLFIDAAVNNGSINFSTPFSTRVKTRISKRKKTSVIHDEGDDR